MLLYLLHFLLEDKKKNLFYIIIIILFNSKMTATTSYIYVPIAFLILVSYSAMISSYNSLMCG